MDDIELKIVEKKKLIRNTIENIGIYILKDQLLKHFELEYKLNDHLSSLPKQVVISALERFEKKLKGYQQIEKDLSNSFILSGEECLLSGKLDILRLNLAILYADSLGSEIPEEKSRYDRIKDFIFKILSLKKIQLKLKCFDLIIKLLEKNIEDSRFNTEYITALDLLKLFVNEPHALSIPDLQYISNLGRETNEEDIRKCFYGIVRELNEKLLFQDLLKQLLKIIEKQRNTPLILFNIIFITKCLNDPEMNIGDLNQVISLVCHVLDHYNELTTKQPSVILRKLFNQSLIDLNEFKKDLKEKISPAIIINSANQSWQGKNSDHVADILQELDFAIYFPIHINNEKIKTKLSESKFYYNHTLEKKNPANDRFTFKAFKERIVKISSKVNKIMANAKYLASDAKENLEEIAETNTDRLTNFFKKKSEIIYSEKNEKIDKKNMIILLIQAKEKLLPIKEKLDSWNLILHTTIDQNDTHLNEIDLSQFDLNQCLELVDRLNDSTNKTVNDKIQQIVTEFEKINTIKEKGNWYLIPEFEPSLFHKIFRYGYLNSNYTIKKIRVHFGVHPSFIEINNFILKQSFCRLLTFGIIRWPWMLKINFACSWAEKLCLPGVINQTKELKSKLLNNMDNELLEKVITLSKDFFPYKNQVDQILNSFKSYVVATLNVLEALKQKIEESLSEDNYPFALATPPNGFFDKKSLSSNSEINTMTDSAIHVSLNRFF